MDPSHLVNGVLVYRDVHGFCPVQGLPEAALPRVAVSLKAAAPEFPALFSSSFEIPWLDGLKVDNVELITVTGVGSLLPADLCDQGCASRF